MGRPSPWLWLLLALLLLAPTPIGRLLLDLIGGLTLTLLLLPLLAGGAALIGWQLLKRRLRTCPSCGTLSLGQAVCPACGTMLDPNDGGGSDIGAVEIDPRNVTINVEATDVEPGSGDSPRSR
jgi:hypothetical protein